MAEFLVIRLPADADAAADWVAVDDSGSRRSPPATGALRDAAADVGDRSVIVLAPGRDVLSVTVDLPARGARLQAALPFALEDQLADDIEDLHFAAGKRLDNGHLPAAVVAHERMRTWLERLADAGIRPDRLVPENHGLARIPNTTSLLLAGDEILFNDGADTEFVMEGLSPAEVVAAASVRAASGDDAGAAPPRHLLVYCEPADQARFENDWATLREELDSVDINLLPEGVLPRLAVTVAAGAGVNLLTGPYAEKAEVGALFRPWRHAAALVAAIVVAALAGKAVDYYRLTREEAALREQFTAEYRELRPGFSGEVVDPVGTVRSLRRSIGGPAGAPAVFLPSLEALSRALVENSAAELEAISYRAGVVNVNLSAPDVTTLDRIQKLVSESPRFTARIEATNQVGDRVSSRIEITESGA